jgi:hypothetical protein
VSSFSTISFWLFGQFQLLYAKIPHIATRSAIELASSSRARASRRVVARRRVGVGSPFGTPTHGPRGRGDRPLYTRMRKQYGNRRVGRRPVARASPRIAIARRATRRARDDATEAR